jgi:hypothetical protein
MDDTAELGIRIPHRFFARRVRMHGTSWTQSVYMRALHPEIEPDGLYVFFGSWKFPDPKEQQVMRWIVEQRQAGWTWERIYFDLLRRHAHTRADRE